MAIENNNLTIHSDPWIKSERDSIRNSCDVFLERTVLPGCSSTRPPDDRHPPGQDWASPQAVDGLVQDRDLDGGAGRGVKRLLHCFVQPSRPLEAPALLHPSFSFLLRDPQISHSPPLLKPPDPRAAQVVPTQWSMKALIQRKFKFHWFIMNTLIYLMGGQIWLWGRPWSKSQPGKLSGNLYLKIF